MPPETSRETEPRTSFEFADRASWAKQCRRRIGARWTPGAVIG